MPNKEGILTDTKESGGIGLAILLVAIAIFLGLVLLFGACDALFNGENAMAYPTSESNENQPCKGEGSCQDRSKKGCAEATAPCSDDDKVTVIICIHPDSCRFGPERAT